MVLALKIKINIIFEKDVYCSRLRFYLEFSEKLPSRKYNNKIKIVFLAKVLNFRT